MVAAARAHATNIGMFATQKGSESPRTVAKNPIMDPVDALMVKHIFQCAPNMVPKWFHYG